MIDIWSKYFLVVVNIAILSMSMYIIKFVEL